MAIEGQVLRALFLPLFFLLAPFAYLMLKRLSLNNSFKYLYLNKRDFHPLGKLLPTFRDSLLLFVAMVALSFLLSYALSLFGLQDLYKVEALIRKQPLYVLAIAVFISPFSEEIFFRGFLQHKAGLPLSALLFAVFHALYGSIAEVLGAFLLALLLGAYVSYRKSLAAPMLAHVLFNGLSVLPLIL